MMPRLPTNPLTRPPRLGYTFHSRILPRYSSGSPTPSPSSQPAASHFNKTGEKDASDPAQINIRSDEYSKSGGDDIVAEQTVASFRVRYAATPCDEDVH